MQQFGSINLSFQMFMAHNVLILTGKLLMNSFELRKKGCAQISRCFEKKEIRLDTPPFLKYTRKKGDERREDIFCAKITVINICKGLFVTSPAGVKKD